MGNSIVAWSDSLSPDVIASQQNPEMVSFDQGPEFAKRVSDIYKQNPWTKPETILALARGYATPEAAEAVGYMSAINKVQENAQQQADIGIPSGLVKQAGRVVNAFGFGMKWLGKGLGLLAPDQLIKPVDFLVNDAQDLISQFKPVVRYGVAGLDIIPELTQYLSSRVFDGFGMDIQYDQNPEGSFWESTSIGQLLMNNTPDEKGWFISEDLREAQAREARARRGTLNGHAFTTGRGVAGLITTPGSEPHAWISGTIDFAQMIAVPDPTKFISKGVKALQSARGVVPLVSDASRMASLIDDTLDVALNLPANATPAQILAAEMGVTKSLSGGSLDVDRFVSFMKTKPIGKKLVQSLIDKKDPGEIFSEVFRGQGSTEVAYNLSKASTEDQVIGSLLGAYTFGAEPISRSIGNYLPMFNSYTPWGQLNNVMKRSRLLAEVPDTMIVTAGSSADNTKSVKNYINSLKGMGVGNEEIKSFTTLAVSSLREGAARTDAYVLDNVYNDYVRKSLTANKIKDEVIEEMLDNRRSSIDSMRSYFKDRQGVNTDAGFMSAMLNLPAVKSTMNSVEWNRLVSEISTSGGGHGTDLAFASAIQHADLMNRVSYLPDHRELRRLTRNPLWLKVLSAGTDEVVVGGSVKTGQTTKVARIGKLPILSKRVKKDNIIQDRVKWNELVDESNNIKLASAAMPPGTNTAQTIRLGEIEAEKAALVKPQRVLTGEQRLAVAMADVFQNSIWKPFTLMTGGYYVRNAIDAQVRMAFGTGTSLLRHPLEYIMLVVGRDSNVLSPIKGAYSRTRGLTGESLMGGGSLKDPESEISLMEEAMRNRVSTAARTKGMSSADFQSHMKKTGSFADVTRDMPGNGMTLHTDGVVQQLQKIQKNKLSQMAARSMVGAKSRNQIVSDIRAEIKLPKNKAIYNDIKARFKEGIEEFNVETNQTVRFAPVDFDEILKDPKLGAPAVNSILDVYAEKIILGNALNQTGNVPALQFVAAYDRMPYMVGDELEKVVADSTNLRTPANTAIPAGGIKRGDIVKLKDDRLGVVIVGSKTKSVTVVPIKESNSLTKTRSGSISLRETIKATNTWDDVVGKGLPRVVSREITGTNSSDLSTFAKVEEGMNRTTQWFFTSLNERSSRVLERSPVFRSNYYKHVDEHVGDLSPTEAKKFLDDIKLQLAPGQTAGKYIGNDKLVKRIEAIAADKSGTGTLTVTDLDDYAKMRSLNEMEDMLFNASNTNNLKDILRIIVPFGNAWSEVIGHYGMGLLHDGIHQGRTFTRVYNGLQSADPDQDGRGFFYKDPQTDEQMFSFPASGAISRIFTGGDFTAGLSAPIKRLSQGINVYPGLGPYAQVLASTFLADVPKNDEIRAILLPYGSPDIGGLAVPGWVRKAYEAIEGNTDATTGIFANTYFETIKAEANTGKYNLSLPQEQERLKNEAKKKARWLTGIRALSQLFGPTSGEIAFKIPTNQGDVYVKEIVSEFHKMQAEDYDSAVERFLKLHGENAALYVSSKSEAVQPGLETTDDFSDWQRNNQDLITTYGRTANYLAPAFGEFDFKVLERQTKSGARKSLNADEIIELAQNRIGSSRYRAAKLSLGQYPSEDQAQRLAEFRVKLSLEYPGFKPKAEFTTNEYSNDLSELARLVDDPRVGWNPSVPSIKQYLSLRQQLIQQSGRKTLNSKGSAPIRAQLFVAGEALAKQNVYFDRIWQRLLAQEVED